MGELTAVNGETALSRIFFVRTPVTRSRDPGIARQHGEREKV